MINRTIRLACGLSLIGLLTIQSAFAQSTNTDAATTLTVRVSNGWTIVESQNFRCWSQLVESDTRRLAESCEAWRSRLRTTWITSPDRANWIPKCDVYVHPNRSVYNQTLNRPGDSSVGTTTMNFDHGRTVMRRIDVRADASDWSNAALPHELTHVVLGERFGGHALPRWADEGIAMLSESAEKHRERLVNLQETLTARPTLTMAELVSSKQMPAAHLRDAFYGQSLALSSFLVRKSTPARFADFVDASMVVGIEQALLDHYKLSGVAGLQHEWNAWVKTPGNVSFVSLPIQVGKTSSIASSVAP